MHLFVLCGSQNKQRLFLYTALAYLFCNRGAEGLLRGTNWVFKSDRYSFFLKGLNSIFKNYKQILIYCWRSCFRMSFRCLQRELRTFLHKVTESVLACYLPVLFKITPISCIAAFSSLVGSCNPLEITAHVLVQGV